MSTVVGTDMSVKRYRVCMVLYRTAIKPPIKGTLKEDKPPYEQHCTIYTLCIK